MSRTKPSGMTHYELLYIISNRFTEEETKPIVEKINKLITDNGGRITFEEFLGKRKLAYRIKNFNHAYYQLTEFDLQGASLLAVERFIRLSSDIIRHQVIIKKVKTEAEKEKEKIIEKKIADKNAAKEAEKEKKKEVAKEKAKPKVDLKELDEKLDKILESDNLL